MEQQQASGVNKSNRKPNFLIVGAAKAGTTSLANYLNQHPDIFIPEAKELRFFVKDTILKTNPKDPLLKGILKSSVLDEDDYFALFQRKEKLLGEASVHYLYHYEEAIPKIKKYLGDIPIIIMLRNPVKRAISNYEYLKGIHTRSFSKELKLEESRINEQFNAFWYYKQLGLYYKQVNAYLKAFKQVKVIIFEDFVKNQQTEMDELFKFLGVSPISLNFKIHNQSVNHSMLRRFVNKTRISIFFKFFLPSNKKEHIIKKLTPILVSNKKNHLTDDELIELKTFFKEDTLNLESLLNIKLDNWYINYTNKT